MPEIGSRKRLYMELLSQAVALGGLLWGLKVCLSYLDPYREQREQAKKRAVFLKRYLGVSLELNEFEQLLVANVLNPNHIDVTLADVHGLGDIIQQMNLKVIYPLLNPSVYSTSLLRQTKGVLLYGPPGTGKTMLAKALARESGCFFLNITASSIISKWLGDANRLVKAVFSLAQKLEPCIVFIDEVDAMLGKRGAQQEHEATLQVKTEFMQLWDGIESNRSQRVVVMGATNRPWMVDEAVLRRFTLQYEVGLPTLDQRRDILLGYLRKHCLECGPTSVAPELLSSAHTPTSASGTPSASAPHLQHQAAVQAQQPQPHAAPLGLKGSSVATPAIASRPSASTSTSTANGMASTVHTPTRAGPSVVRDLDWVAAHTEGFSGSDLLELCSQAAQHVLEEHWMAHRPGQDHLGDAVTLDSLQLRPITGADFEHALRHIQPSTAKADEYSNKEWMKAGGVSAGRISNEVLMEAMMALMMKVAQVPDQGK